MRTIFGSLVKCSGKDFAEQGSRQRTFYFSLASFLATVLHALGRRLALDEVLDRDIVVVGGKRAFGFDGESEDVGVDVERTLERSSALVRSLDDV